MGAAHAQSKRCTEQNKAAKRTGREALIGNTIEYRSFYLLIADTIPVQYALMVDRRVSSTGFLSNFL